MADIGKPQRIIEVEPMIVPEPVEEPLEDPRVPNKEPVEPEKVPA